MTLTGRLQKIRGHWREGWNRCLSFATRASYPVANKQKKSKAYEFYPDRSSARVVDTYEIPGELTSRLTESGFDLSDETERRRVAQAAPMGKAAAFRVIDLRKKGVAIETLPRPAPLKTD